MGLESLYMDGVASPEEEEGPLWSAEALVHFDTFRLAFRSWQEATDALDWIQRNEHAVTLLASSNVLPSHFTRALKSGAERPTVPLAALSATHTAVALVVRSACCDLSVQLSEAEQLTLVELPRVFPFRQSSQSAAPNPNSSCGSSDYLSAQLTIAERHERVLEGLLSRLHRCDCVWHDPVSRQAACGVKRDVAPCTARQLLLGGPSLRVTDATLVRAFCAAVSLSSVGAKKEATARERCLLPRGTPPSVLRTWMEEAVQVLSPAPSVAPGDDWAGRTPLPKLRYEGSNVNDRILQLFFTPRKRQRPDGSTDGAVTGEVVMDYMGLLMGLYGYAVEVADPSGNSNASTTKEDPAAAGDDEDEEGSAAAGSSSQPAPSGQWDGPPVVLNSFHAQEGNDVRHVETVRQRRSFHASEAATLLRRCIRCRYCAHAPWTSVVQEDVTTRATTTTKRIVVTTTADPISWARGVGEGGSDDGVDAGCGLAPSPSVHEPDAEEAPRASSLSSVPAEDSETVLEESAVEEDAEEREVEEKCGEQQASAPQFVLSAPPSEGDVQEAAEEDAPEQEDTPHDTTTATTTPTASEPLQLDAEEDVAAPPAVSAVDESAVPPVSTADAPLPPAPAAITTVTKAVTTTSTIIVTESTTTILVTFSRRNTAPYVPGHAECCPWHRLFLNDAIDGTALATAERPMDFTWVVESPSAAEAAQPADACAGGDVDGEDGNVDGAPEEEEEEEGSFTSSVAELAVMGKTVTLHSGPEPETQDIPADIPDADNKDSKDCSDSCTESVTHRTVLTFRVFVSEVERLITAWRLSEEWERVRPSQYLQHPLWRTWSTSAVLHPIHAKAGDNVMEQHLRTLERRLTSTNSRDERAEEEGEGNETATTVPSAQMLRACLTADGALLATLGAPLSPPSDVAAGATVERVVRLAEASVKKLGEHDRAATSTTSSAPLPQPPSSSAQSLLKAGLQALLLRSSHSDAVTATADVASHTDGGAPLSAPVARDDAVATILADTQQRYSSGVSAVEESPFLRFCAALRGDAVPHMLSTFTAPHYSTVRLANITAVSGAGSAAAAAEPSFTVERSSAAGSASLPSIFASPHGMTSADRASVVKYLDEMRQTIQHEQLQQQREQELEAAHIAAAAAAAAAAAKAREEAAQAALAAQRTAAATASPHSNQRSLPHASTQHQHQQQHQQQQRNTGGSGGFNSAGQYSGVNAHAGAANTAPSNTSGRGGDRYGVHPHLQQQQQQRQQTGQWSGGPGFGGAPPPLASSPQPVFATFHPTPNPFGAPSPSSILGPQAGGGGGGGGGGSAAVIGDSGGVLAGPSPFNWSPLAFEGESGGGGANAGVSGGEGVLSFSGGQRNSSSAASSSSPRPPPILGGGGYNSGSVGGRPTEGRPARGPFNSGSVLNSGSGSGGGSGGSTGGAEVRLSNWSVGSSATHTSTGSILPSPAAPVGGVLARGGPGGGGMAPSGEQQGQRTAPPPSVLSGRGGASNLPIPRSRGGGGEGPRVVLQQNTNLGGGHGTSSPHASGPNSAHAAVLSGGGRGGRGRGRGGPPWRGGGGGGGRGNHRRGGG